MISRCGCRSMKTQLLVNLNWLFADKIVRLVGGLFVGVWVARYLGPDLFGVFSYALAFVAMFGAVSRLGMDQVVIRGVDTVAGETGRNSGFRFRPQAGRQPNLDRAGASGSMGGAGRRPGFRGAGVDRRGGTGLQCL